MIFEYDKRTGVIYNAISSRELSKGSCSIFEAKPQRTFIGGDGKPVRLKHTRDVISVRDTDISMQYLMFLRDEYGNPNFKFILKSGKPVSIVPITGEYPKGWKRGSIL